MFSFLAARVARKRGKMNLEKTINKNMFDILSSIHEKNPLETADLLKNDHYETTSSPTSSILSYPKQKLTAQFKRAITMIKQRSEPADDSLQFQFPTSIPLNENTNHSLDSNLLTSLVEETTDNHTYRSEEISTPKSQSCGNDEPIIMHLSSNQATKSVSKTAPTVINLDSTEQINNHNENPSTNIIKPNLPKIHSSTIETINQQSATPQISLQSSRTLNATPISSARTSGEIAILETIL